jgi:ATP-binding cassette subfamily B protein
MIAWLWSIWRPYRLWLLAILALTVANGAVVARIPLALGGAFAELEAHGGWPRLMGAIDLLIALGVLRFALYCGLQSLRARMNTVLEAEIRNRVSARLLQAGPTVHGRFSRGDILTRLMDDAGYDKLCWLLCTGSLRVVEGAVVIASVTVAMASIDEQLALWCLLPIPLLFALTQLLYGRVSHRFVGLQVAISRVATLLDETFSSMRLVKALTMEWTLRDRFNTVARQRESAEIGAARAKAAIENMYALIGQLAAILTVLLGGRMVVEGRLSVADFIAFNGFAVSVTMPLGDIGGFLARTRQAWVCAERVRELERVPIEIRLEEGPVDAALRSGEPAYTLRDVHFSWGSNTVLEELDLEIRRGDAVAVRGRVGAGKTTLLRLLLRAIDPARGTVTREGADLRALPRSALIEEIGYVPQRPVVLSGTVAENVSFGRNLSPEAIRRALEIAGLADEIAALPDDVHSQLGVSGVRLSGGQQQRLSIARAVAANPRVLLLDNATSALDPATESRVWAALRAALPAATIVACTHSEAFLRLADRIVSLDGPSRGPSAPTASGQPAPSPPRGRGLGAGVLS